MIEINDVHKSFGTLHVLKGINLTVEKGEVISIIGSSGSGKSTLLNCINALESIQGGQILVDGTDVHAKETDVNKLRRKIGMVFQQWNSFPHLTTLENAALAPRIVMGKTRQEAKEIARKQLEHVGLGDKFDVYPNKLSGGQQQRVAVARAVVSRPKLILADEPTGNLDSAHGDEVMDLLTELNKNGTTIVMVTHSTHDASYSHRIIHLFDGHVVTENIKEKFHV